MIPIHFASFYLQQQISGFLRRKRLLTFATYLN